MFGEAGKNRLLVFLMVLMAIYFISINFLKEIDKKNSNNSYVSMNLVYTSKEGYISEYLENIKNKKYFDAYYMLDDETKAKFGNELAKFKEFAEYTYKNINNKMWKFECKLLNENDYRKYNMYTYEVIDGESKDTTLIDRITVYEYAVNVFKLHLEGGEVVL